MLRNASALIVLADRQRASLLKLGVLDEKIHTVAEGIDSQKFSPVDKDDKLASRYALEGKRVILTVGRLVKRKGHDMVIKSLPQVMQKIPEAMYFIVGTGPEEQNIRELIDELDLKENVVLAGFVADDDLPRIYSVSDVFIMPSREIGGDIEGFGLVFLEASACGRPVIGGRSGGISDAVEDGVSGILVDPLNADEIAWAILDILTKKDLAMTLGRQGRERIEREFSFEANAEKMREILKTIKAGGKGRRRK